MKVELISHTHDALTLLLRTKGTRLAHGDDPAGWPEEKRLAELAYMKDTIKSSWEFVDFVFEVSDVPRSFTHQYVRTRAGSYAQESQRTVDVRDHGVQEPAFPNEDARALWHWIKDQELAAYAKLVDLGMPPQDSRGILPTDIFTSIIAKFNLRTLHEMAFSRLCVRTQGVYQSVFREMKARVVEVYPWAETFIRVGCAQNGICVFPRYAECPIGHMTYNNVASKSAGNHKHWIEAIASAAEGAAHEARPVAKDGRTM